MGVFSLFFCRETQKQHLKLHKSKPVFTTVWLM